MKWYLKLLVGWGNSLDDVEAEINSILSQADAPETIRVKLFDFLSGLKTHVLDPEAWKMQVAAFVAEITSGKLGVDPDAAGLL